MSQFVGPWMPTYNRHTLGETSVHGNPRVEANQSGVAAADAVNFLNNISFEIEGSTPKPFDPLSAGISPPATPKQNDLYGILVGGETSSPHESSSTILAKPRFIASKPNTGTGAGKPDGVDAARSDDIQQFGSWLSGQ